MTAMTESGFRGIGNINEALMAGKGFGSLATGNGDRNNEEFRGILIKKAARHVVSGGFLLVSTFLHHELQNVPYPVRL